MQKDIVERLKDFPTLAKLAALGDPVSAQAIECFSRDAMLEIEHLRRSQAASDADLKETLRAVLHFFGPEGANKVCTHALKAREIRYDNDLIDEIEAGLNDGIGIDPLNTSEI